MTVVSDQCLHVPTGKEFLFVRHMSPGLNGGLPTNSPTLHSFSHGMGFPNTNDAVEIFYNGLSLDVVTYTTEVSSGVARQIDDNDNVCDAVNAYGVGDFGTPGQNNPSCL